MLNNIRIMIEQNYIEFYKRRMQKSKKGSPEYLLWLEKWDTARKIREDIERLVGYEK